MDVTFDLGNQETSQDLHTLEANVGHLQGLHSRLCTTRGDSCDALLQMVGPESHNVHKEIGCDLVEHLPEVHKSPSRQSLDHMLKCE